MGLYSDIHSLNRYAQSWTISALCLLLFVFLPPVFGQEQQAKLAPEYLIWQQRVNDLTDEIIEDSSFVDDSEKFLYLALLAKIWLKEDPIKARKYLEDAASKVISVWEKRVEDKGDLAKNTTNSEKTLRIIIGIDEKIGQSLSEKVATLIEERGNKAGANADLFAMIALQVVDKNPRLAYTLGLKALNYGNSLNLLKLITQLRSKDTKLSDDLLGHILAAALREYDFQIIASLENVVFGGQDVSPGIDQIRRIYLTTLAERLALSALDERNRKFCELVAVAAPLSAKFDEYLPEHSLAVRQHIELCIPFSPSFTAETARAGTRYYEPKTPDDFVRAARDANDPGLKARYFSKAVAILAQTKKFDEIVSLLDNLTEDEKKAIGEVAWNSWRIEYASASAFVYFEINDLASVFRVIDKTPKVIRPFVRFRLVGRVNLNENREFVLENIEKIRDELGAIEVPFNDAASSFLVLSRLYVQIQPLESGRVFQEAVKYINKTDGENPDFLAEKDYAPLRDYISLPSELIESDESGIRVALANVSSRRSRIRLKLGLLESALHKLSNVDRKRNSDDEGAKM